MSKIEVSAKTIDKAIEEGLKQLGVSLDEVEINVLSEGGLFKKAKIEMVISEKENKVDNKKKKANDVEFTDKELEFLGEKKKDNSEKVVEAPAKAQKTEKKKKAEKKEEPVKESKEVSTDEIKPIKNREERRKERVTVEVTPKLIEDVKETGKVFLEGLIKDLELDATVSINDIDGNIEFSIDGTNLGSIIGYRGSALEALQHLLNIIIGNKTQYKKRVFLNIENYRQKREETLKSMAERIAKKVIESQRRCKLEPMSSFERRIIHAYLNERAHIATRSEGVEPNRYLIIEYTD